MGKIERRVLAAALAGAIAMCGVVGFLRSEPETAPAQGVPVSVTSPYLTGEQLSLSDSVRSGGRESF